MNSKKRKRHGQNPTNTNLSLMAKLLLPQVDTVGGIHQLTTLTTKNTIGKLLGNSHLITSQQARRVKEQVFKDGSLDNNMEALGPYVSHLKDKFLGKNQQVFLDENTLSVTYKSDIQIAEYLKPLLKYLTAIQIQNLERQSPFKENTGSRFKFLRFHGMVMANPTTVDNILKSGWSSMLQIISADGGQCTGVFNGTQYTVNTVGPDNELLILLVFNHAANEKTDGWLIALIKTLDYYPCIEEYYLRNKKKIPFLSDQQKGVLSAFNNSERLRNIFVPLPCEYHIGDELKDNRCKELLSTYYIFTRISYLKYLHV